MRRIGIRGWRLRSAISLLAALVFAWVTWLRLPGSVGPAPSEADGPAPARVSLRREDEPLSPSPLRRHATEVVRGYERQGLFRGAVLLARQPEIVEIQAGLADEGRQELIRSGSLFRLGSVSKHFAAVAALALEEQKRLRITDPVEKYLPEYPPANLELNGKKVTIHHLLRHTSGLPAADGVLRSVADRTMPVSAARLIELIKHKGLESVPGESYAYNNANYEVLALIISRVSGVSVETLVRGLVARASASDIGVVPNEHERTRLVRGYVPLAGRWVDIHRALGVPDAAFPVISASGNLFASARGLFDWFKGLMDGRVIGAPALAQLLAPGARHYGYGLVIDEVDGWKRLSHSGSVPGFVSRLEYYPDVGGALILLSNGTPEGALKQLARDLRDVLHRPEAPPQLHTATRPVIERALVGVQSFVLLVFSPTAHGVLLQALLIAVIFFGFLPKERSRSAHVASGFLQGSVLGIVLAMAGAGAPLISLLTLCSAGLTALGVRFVPAAAIAESWGVRARRYITLAACLPFAAYALYSLERLVPFAMGGVLLGALLALRAPGALVSRYGRELERHW